jgi:hypothetical protein
MNVIWLSLNPELKPKGMWDQGLLEFIFKDWNNWESNKIPHGISEAVVIIPGAYQQHLVKEINQELTKLEKCKVIITSDEENLFPIDELSHSNMKLYATYPNDKYTSGIHWLPIGPARLNDNFVPDKQYDFVYAGQVNHDSRRKLVEVLKTMPDGLLIETGGFSQGLPRDEYYDVMSNAKLAPAPKGVVSTDSFRLYEAMEVGAIPVTEDRPFWDRLFGDYPFLVVEDWSHLVDTEYSVKTANRIQAWWQRKKLEIQDEFIEQGDVTVIMPTSPIKSHPSTEKIDEVIKSVRYHMPDTRIIVTFDGVRPEQEHLRENYEEYIRRFLSLHNNENIYPIIFDEYTHQVGMARVALNHVKTPVIFYAEHDISLYPEPLEWEAGAKSIIGGKLDMLRYHFEVEILDVHKYMMVDENPIDLGVPVIRTFQFSQRPHLASTEWYKRILNQHFTPQAKSFIEDHMHGVVADSYAKTKDWSLFKIGIYNPEGSIKRAFHLDGREGESKWDDIQVF